jgi:hypothetical protein
MSLLQLSISYFLWHYALAWEDLFRLYRNGSWFLWNFFSIRILWETLFSPWHRIKEHADKDTAGVLGSFIMDTILRLVGFFTRICTILSGLLTLILFSAFSLICLALWPFLPLCIVAFFMLGISGAISFSDSF